jgi:GDSL-like lipase/acylhydrolase family protein
MFVRCRQINPAPVAFVRRTSAGRSGRRRATKWSRCVEMPKRDALILLLCAACGAGPGTCGEQARRLRPEINVERVLFLGNSITRHGPAPEIGWKGDWGMAASAPERDYVHVVTDDLAALSGRTPRVMASNIAEFETTPATYDIDARLKAELDFRPTLVIVAIGENVGALRTHEARARFRAGFARLLGAVKGAGEPSIVVRGCFWADTTKDEIMRQACGEAGAVFVDIRPLCRNDSNFANSERHIQNAAVGAHPGDRGMKAIADMILRALTTSDAPGHEWS